MGVGITFNLHIQNSNSKVVISLSMDYLNVTSHAWVNDHKYKTIELVRS
jgi:hypothetical protein